MFKDNKYTRCYNSIISRAKSRVLTEYSEVHHVIPKSLGGSNDLNNLVSLTAREHYICHLLLVKMTSGVAYQKMLYAYTIMSGRNIYNSKKYQFFREQYSKINSELRTSKGNGMYGADRSGSNNTFYGKQHSEETKRRISEKKKGHSYNKGIPKSETHKKKLSEAKRKNAKQFLFVHQDFGTINMSIPDLSEKFSELNLRKDELWKLTAKKYKTYKGWSVLT